MYQIKTSWAGVLSFSWLNQTDSTETTQDPRCDPTARDKHSDSSARIVAVALRRKYFPSLAAHWNHLETLRKKKSGPWWQRNSVDISGLEAEHFFFFFGWGKFEFFKVPQVILFSLTTLSSVWDTSSQMREQTLVTPLHLSAVEA